MAARIRIVAVGKLDAALRPVFEHYRRLLAPHVRLDVQEVREVALRGRETSEVLREEARRILPLLAEALVVVALAVDGRGGDSLSFAQRLVGWMERGDVTFVIGGTLGLDASVTSRATESLSLSPLTLPHQLARIVLAEQLFRAVKIDRGEAYHH